MPEVSVGGEPHRPGEVVDLVVDLTDPQLNGSGVEAGERAPQCRGDVGRRAVFGNDDRPSEVASEGSVDL